MRTGNEKLVSGEGFTDFVQNNRKPIFISASVVVLALAVTIVALVVSDFSRNRAVAAVEELGLRFRELGTGSPAETGFGIDDGADIGTAEDGEASELVLEIRRFAEKNSGYAGARAWSMVAGFHGGKKQWAQAEEAWLAAARAAGNSYMGPIALFNAAVAAEEQGKPEAALEHYRRSLASKVGFFAAPRAQLAVGRLLEVAGDTEGAVEAYRRFLSLWPEEATMAGIANSRIIVLER